MMIALSAICATSHMPGLIHHLTQENPETVPTGEMPRHISLALDRYLVAAVKVRSIHTSLP